MTADMMEVADGARLSHRKWTPILDRHGRTLSGRPIYEAPVRGAAGLASKFGS